MNGSIVVATVAQLVEHFICNEKCAGSIPVCGSCFIGVWAKGWPLALGARHQVSSILTIPTVYVC